MVLESTVVCVDNSEWMRNGDFRPTRLDSQRDAVNLVCGNKLQSNPENTVALMTLAKREVLVTLTDDMGKLLTSSHAVRAGGSSDFVGGLQVAQLALKHRTSKNHRQRIIIFVGSPVEAEPKQLTQLGKKLKKSNVSVDVVSFGEEEANREKLEAFLAAVNKDDTSHLVSVPSGSGPLSDSLVSSPILDGGSGGGGGMGGGGGQLNEFGVDPSVDPELALAMRISMEEEHARQAAEAAAASGGDADAPAAAQPSAADGPDAELQAAMAMSLEGMGEGGAESAAPSGGAAPMQTEQESSGGGGFGGYGGMSEEEQMRLAIEMSMNEAAAPTAATSMDTEPDAEEASAAGADAGDMGAALTDPNFLSSVLGTLPGVDPEDAQIKEVLASLASPDKKGEGKDEADK